jgi:hypothetical protein
MIVESTVPAQGGWELAVYCGGGIALMPIIAWAVRQDEVNAVVDPILCSGYPASEWTTLFKNPRGEFTDWSGLVIGKTQAEAAAHMRPRWEAARGAP